MASMILDRFARVVAYMKPRPASTKSVPVKQNTWRERDSTISGRFFFENNGGAFRSYQRRPSNDHVPALRDRVKRLKSALLLTFVFIWTLVLTLLVVIWAVLLWLVPDKCRKTRDISSSIVLVTNAGRGLGRRLAIILALKAAVVVCWDPDYDRHMNTVYDIRHRGGRALGFTVDVTDEAAVAGAAEAMRREVGDPAIVVMSAGRCPRRALLRWTPADLEEIFRANVTPHLVLLRTFLPEMLARNDGHLVCIISASAAVPCWFDAVYAATKVGVAALMRGLAEELEMDSKNKVCLTSVYPHHTERRPPLGQMADIVVSKVLRGRKHVDVPKLKVFWLKLLRTLPVLARRKWCSFVARPFDKKPSRTGSPWGATCPNHNAMQALLTERAPSPENWHGEGFAKNAPYEMASFTSFDNVPLSLKKRKVNTFEEDGDDGSLEEQ